jgi:hypothetical protein
LEAAVTLECLLLAAGPVGSDESMPQVQLNHIDPDGAGGADIQHVIETWLKQQARFRLPGDRETVIYPLTFAHQAAVSSALHGDAAAGSMHSGSEQTEAHAGRWLCSSMRFRNCDVAEVLPYCCG